jgi:alpha-ketoglutarate-dependent taurine dioxygenase
MRTEAPLPELEPPGEVVRTRLLDGGTRLPLVIEPAGADRGAGALAGWLSGHRGWVAERLLRHGALLLRGFAVDTPPEFERVARAIDDELKNDYLGTSPRDALTDYIFSASELPPYYPIPQHCEMSFTRNPPRKLFFCCLIPSAGSGGETPLVDFRQVLVDLDPKVRERFQVRGVRNIRNYSGPKGGSRFDLWKLKRWDEMFRTTDRAAVEAKCRDNQFGYRWKSGERLELTNVQPAMQAHPVSGELAWFNHSQVFHLSAAPGEYRRLARRIGEARYRWLGRVAAAMVLVKSRLGRTEDQAMHCTYGDGTAIPDADMECVRDAIWKNMVFFKWERGDVVAIDNFSVAHGRMPYRGPRKIAVCWA